MIFIDSHFAFQFSTSSESRTFNWKISYLQNLYKRSIQDSSSFVNHLYLLSQITTHFFLYFLLFMMIIWWPFTKASYRALCLCSLISLAMTMNSRDAKEQKIFHYLQCNIRSHWLLSSSKVSCRHRNSYSPRKYLDFSLEC